MVAGADASRACHFGGLRKDVVGVAVFAKTRKRKLTCNHTASSHIAYTFSASLDQILPPS